ncbi:uncharacterized protein RHIMIDRAFT_245870 [Rhizopus microsporus ATCC 52813]|uniref:Uncharacterized protein n=1 Tax=Rhizopus microsporus ATCC 52813 TaxID=1340429 RepID=A0A2G4SLJ1_RHIZD|nr:uncharacterized protein RHIMIDRAFT_245870 [Rhizopus microsporus ATCC 52813]PHZ09657.1 hypothetical protein RHIMIDRAFT_245870 [Rhizopus microsporus ATCC 52813]
MEDNNYIQKNKLTPLWKGPLKGSKKSNLQNWNNESRGLHFLKTYKRNWMVTAPHNCKKPYKDSRKQSLSTTVKTGAHQRKQIQIPSKNLKSGRSILTSSLTPFTVLRKTQEFKPERLQKSTSNFSMLRNEDGRKKTKKFSQKQSKSLDDWQYLAMKSQKLKKMKPERRQQKLSSFLIVSNTWKVHQREIKNTSLTKTSFDSTMPIPFNSNLRHMSLEQVKPTVESLISNESRGRNFLSN